MKGPLYLAIKPNFDIEKAAYMAYSLLDFILLSFYRDLRNSRIKQKEGIIIYITFSKIPPC